VTDGRKLRYIDAAHCLKTAAFASVQWASSQVSESCGWEPGTTTTQVLSLIKDFFK
jgi:hypothetical protein